MIIVTLMMSMLVPAVLVLAVASTAQLPFDPNEALVTWEVIESPVQDSLFKGLRFWLVVKNPSWPNHLAHIKTVLLAFEMDPDETKSRTVTQCAFNTDGQLHVYSLAVVGNFSPLTGEPARVEWQKQAITPEIENFVNSFPGEQAEKSHSEEEKKGKFTI